MSLPAPHQFPTNVPLAASRNASSTNHVDQCLETLDDVVFAAIDGDLTSLHACEPVLRKVLADVGPEAVAESRQEYLRYARLTRDFLRSQLVWQPMRIVAVMHVIALLLGE